MSYAFAFLLILVPLVVFHELGHFLMAKLGGINVSKFAFGFGPKLFGFKYRGTEYCWNLIPLGGYVDFMGDLIYTGEIPEDVNHFYNRPKWIRFMVLVMGPLFNLILALAIYWFIHGAKPYWVTLFDEEPYTVSYVEENSPEALAGLMAGDRISVIDGAAVEDYKQVQEYIIFNPGKTVGLEVQRSGETVTLDYTIPKNDKDGLGTIAFWPKLRVMVGRVIDDKPAVAAGLQASDIITQINGEAVSFYCPKEKSINQLLSSRAPAPSLFRIERGDQVLELEITPLKEEGRWVVGFHFGPELYQKDLNWRGAFSVAWISFKNDSTMIYKGIKKLVIGELPIKTLSGPIEVGKFAKESLDDGYMRFLWLMALLSLNLGIMNLLPIPVLDGGEIFVLLMEAIVRRDFNLMTKMRIKMVGFFFLVGLMGVVIITDVLKIINAV